MGSVRGLSEVTNGVSNVKMVYQYGISVSQITTVMFYLSRTLSDPFLNHDVSLGL
jgi:hypothetical protein